MRVVNTAGLKNKTNELLCEVVKGKPAASLTPLTEDDLEDYLTGSKR